MSQEYLIVGICDKSAITDLPKKRRLDGKFLELFVDLRDSHPLGF